MQKMCMLEENKICDNCLECNYCDLDPGKVCDNCAKCINHEVSIQIDDIIITQDQMRKYRLAQGKIKDYKKARG